MNVKIENMQQTTNKVIAHTEAIMVKIAVVVDGAKV